MLLIRFAPVLFVFLWSTGFVGAKYGMTDAEPFTFLALRFLVAFALIALIVPLFKSKWPTSLADFFHLAIAGALIHGVYLGGVFAAVYHGLPAGISSVIVGVHPLLAALIASSWLGEQVSKINIIGFTVGLTGVILVVGNQSLFQADANYLGVGLCIGSLFGIAFGTLYQKRFCTHTELISGTMIQYAGAFILLAIPAFFLESNEIRWTSEVLGAFIWLVLALSIVATLLLMMMIKHGEINRVSSLFYLVPALASIETWVLFDETLTIVAVCGIGLCMLGVYLARLQPAMKRDS